MAVNYKVAADIHDINFDKPQPSDVFIVDANVWYWMTYSRASLRINTPAPYQTRLYPEYINQALAVGAKIYRSAHALVELTSIVEVAEAEIYRKQTNLQTFSVKEFRHSSASVVKVYKDEISSIWAQIKTMGSDLEQTLNDDLCDRFCQEHALQTLDGYDILISVLAKSHGLTRIITDDGDFSTIPGLIIHTANARVLSAAQRRGRMIANRPAFEAGAAESII